MRRRAALAGFVLAATSLLAAAAGAATAVSTGTAGPSTTAGLEGLAGPVEASTWRTATDAGVWAAEGSRARQLWKARRTGAVASDLEGQALGPIRAVTVVVKGKAHDVVTNARTVQELLSAMRIEPDGDDEVAPPPGTPLRSGTTVRYAAVSYSFRTVLRWVHLPPRPVPSRRVPAGYAERFVPGRPARVVRSYRIRFVDGRAVSRRLVSSMVLRPGRPAHDVLGVASHSMQGEASWYDVGADPWYAVNSGLTAASPWLPFGTHVTVTNLATGASVTVVINDRGPFGGRLIDLSQAAFSRIAPIGQGVAEVRIAW